MKNSFLACLLVPALLALAAGAAHAQTYSYDAAGRLTRVTYEDGTTISYSHDAAGNVTTTEVTPTPPGGGGGGSGCFIATAAYGSPLHPHVQALREFRARHLLSNAPGRLVCVAYAELSPPLAAFLDEHPSLKPAARVLLAPIVLAVLHPRSVAVVVLAVLLALWQRSRRSRALRTQPTH
jgi:YD repeat-containing protein